ncbi:ATP-binding protein [Niveispirillum sp. BGYR6]|uniref:sensor histidine kinase n=1 Tax=Niveispirillum sp. BGYR6 TaxID=2971249 RepID=UPI0022B9B7EA|nr:ATP-binding protein [Niveispirillum sp. BGYR6]MDG5494212.1 histidine kinase [Niveispirillum sp. BGYR6]
MSLRWRIILLVTLAATLSALAGLAVTVAGARVSVRMEMMAALELARAEPPSAALPTHVRHVTRQFVPNGTPLPPAQRHHPGVPGWFAALVWDGADDILLPVEGGVWLQRADPADEVAEVWADTLALAVTAAIMLVLMLLALSVLVGRALAPLNDFALALDRLTEGRQAGPAAAIAIPELAAIGRRIARLDRELAAARAENTALSHSLIALQDQERAQLARDLHDELGPLLFGIRVDAHAISRAAATGPVPGADAAGRAGAIADAAAAIRDLSRRILNRLRPMGLDHLHTAEILRDLTAGLARQHPQTVFTVDLDSAAFARSEAADLTLYRIAHEAILNALRHGQPSRIGLQVQSHADRITLRVSDDGGGMKPDAPPGHGITGMRERVRALGGRFSIASGVDGQTLVEAHIPVPAVTAEGLHHHG